MLTRLSVVLVALYTLPAFAAEPVLSCKDREAYDKEFVALDELLSSQNPKLEQWEYLNRFYLGLVKRFPGCDNGVRGQRLSDEVVYLLAYYWNEFDRFLTAENPDDDFKNFMLAHIDSSGDRQYLEKIVANARERCSQKAKPLCLKINTMAETAISQIR